MSFRVLCDLCRAAVFWLVHVCKPFFLESKNVHFTLHRLSLRCRSVSFRVLCDLCRAAVFLGGACM